MSRYIDADALGIDYCNPDVFENKGYADGWNCAISILKGAPTADVEPVRHGRWFAGTLDDDWDCSYCNRRIFHFGIPSEKYCPHCGAKMDGKGNEK